MASPPDDPESTCQHFLEEFRVYCLEPHDYNHLTHFWQGETDEGTTVTIHWTRK